MRKGEPPARPVLRSTGGERPGAELAYYADNRLVHLHYLDGPTRRNWIRTLLNIELSDRAGD